VASLVDGLGLCLAGGLGPDGRTPARGQPVAKDANASTAWVRRTPARDVPHLDPGYLALITALRQLPAKQRMAIVLHHLVDLPVEQVAAETGSSAAAVKKQLTRGRSALSVLLADDGPESAEPAALTLRKDQR
jgi:RNA polymerase sigma-70 factor (ECF subfamily)